MFGAGAYYMREVWWNKMVMFTPPKRWAKAMHRDRILVALFAIALFGTCLGFAGPTSGMWLAVKMLVIPFLLFCQSIGWVVYVQHIAPEIRWWPRREWNRYRGQVEGTTVLWGPPGWDFFFDWIMVTWVAHELEWRCSKASGSLYRQVSPISSRESDIARLRLSQGSGAYIVYSTIARTADDPRTETIRERIRQVDV